MSTEAERLQGNSPSLVPHSTLCAFYVFQQTEPCDCQGGGLDDPKTALRKISEKDDYDTVIAGSIADRALIAVVWEIEEARARVVEAAKAWANDEDSLEGALVGALMSAVAELERLESKALSSLSDEDREGD